MAQAARVGKLDYTAQELAKILGVTVRSTHRILLQWLDAGLVEVIGIEKITSKGRPRQIYRLSFLSDQVDPESILS
jgi:predicted ArsR family transcriptional regulator